MPPQGVIGARLQSAHPALHLAVWRERLDTVKLLFERGALLETRNRQGETPLSLARHAQTEGSEFTPHESEEVLNIMRTADA